MLRSLVGSEMCIRDRWRADLLPHRPAGSLDTDEVRRLRRVVRRVLDQICLLYTSDAADEEDSVDLGGRRNIKKKKRIIHHTTMNASH